MSLSAVEPPLSSQFDLEEKALFSLTISPSKESSKEPEIIPTAAYSGPEWTLGNCFTDQEKIAEALDKLGPFVMEVYEPVRPTITNRRELFSETESDDVSSSDVRGLRDLQLNDTVLPQELDEDSQTSEKEIDEVSDKILESRSLVEEESSKRKRKAVVLEERSNFVKHNFRRRRRTYPSKHKMTQRRKIKNSVRKE